MYVLYIMLILYCHTDYSIDNQGGLERNINCKINDSSLDVLVCVMMLTPCELGSAMSSGIVDLTS